MELLESIFFKLPWISAILLVSILALALSFLLKKHSWILMVSGFVIGLTGLIVGLLFGMTLLESGAYLALLLIASFIGILIKERRENVI